MRLSRIAVAGIVALLCLGAAACGDSGQPPDAAAEPTPPASEQTAEAAPKQTAEATPAAASAASPSPAASPEQAGAQDYDSTENMRLLFSGRGQQEDDTIRALARANSNADESLVPVVLEAMRFFGSTRVIVAALTYLTDVTGHEPGSAPRNWREWVEWYGNNREDYRPPDGYVRWKADLLSLIDSRLGGFLIPHGEDALIDLTEVMWGGVRPDGIPDLQFVPALAPEDAEYLNPKDRVFGVSINGQHRAYPLRIVNAHEMANDVLGGEPIALAY